MPNGEQVSRQTSKTTEKNSAFKEIPIYVPMGQLHSFKWRQSLATLQVVVQGAELVEVGDEKHLRDRLIALNVRSHKTWKSNSI
jgi:hypothetical protein